MIARILTHLGPRWGERPLLSKCAALDSFGPWKTSSSGRIFQRAPCD